MPTVDRALAQSRGAGTFTGVLGTVLVARPDLGRLAGLTSSRGVRLVGAADAVLAPALVAGRPRWPWVGARAALNVAIAAYVLRVAPGQRTVAIAAGLAAATTADLACLRVLRGAGR